MIARVLSAVGLVRRKTRLDWRHVSSAEMRAGRYTVIADWNNEEIYVSVDGQMRVPGFGSIKEAQDWCEHDWGE